MKKFTKKKEKKQKLKFQLNRIFVNDINFNKNLLLKLLYNAQAFYGCSLKETNVKLFPYIYGSRQKQYLIDLNILINSLKRIFHLINLFIKQNKSILVICNNNNLQFLNLKLTNKNIFFHDSNSTFKWKKNYSHIKLVLLLNLQKNDRFIKEITPFKIPVIAFMDTNQSLKNILYPIIYNTQNIKSIFFIVFLLWKIFNKAFLEKQSVEKLTLLEKLIQRRLQNKARPSKKLLQNKIITKPVTKKPLQNKTKKKTAYTGDKHLTKLVHEFLDKRKSK